MKPQEDAAGLPVDSLEVQAAMAGGGTGRAEPDSHSFLYYYSVLGVRGWRGGSVLLCTQKDLNSGSELSPQHSCKSQV